METAATVQFLGTVSTMTQGSTTQIAPFFRQPKSGLSTHSCFKRRKEIDMDWLLWERMQRFYIADYSEVTNLESFGFDKMMERLWI